MGSTLLRRSPAVLVLCAALVFAACGGGDDDGAGGGGGGRGDTAVRTGGSASGWEQSFPDFLDPALSYTVDGWQALIPSYLQLLSFRRSEGEEGLQLIPAAAQAMPEISQDGKTYTFILRPGLKYSDGTDMKASDFEHAVKRVLNLESGGASWFSGIVGADEYLEANRARADISGIETDDARREIVVRLKEADGRFNYILTMPFSSPVPSDTPFENMTKDPPPASGPFMFANVEINREFTLRRNPNYKPIPGIPAPKLDQFTMRISKNPSRQIQDVLQNRGDYINEPSPGDALREFRQTAAERYEEHVTNSTYYFFLNVRVRPFDDKRVRQAVNFAIDKRALARLFGGQLKPGCNFLPPGMLGYKEIKPCPYGDPSAAPNVAKARQLIQQAGVAGDSVTVYGNDEDPSQQVVEYLANVLNEIGLKARPRIVEGSVYFTTIGNQKTKAQAGWANWFQDFPHPANFLFLVDPDSIQETNNQNYGNVDDPEIKRVLDAANANPDLEAVADQYAAIDRKLVDEAYIAPYGHRIIPVTLSDRIDKQSFIFHPVLQSDYTSFALKR